ncbi:MAG TPA: glycosyltransferase family 39 protein [Dermatophilaceae bacterium]|nr:glycosyltransferase family 39 protein [Dermatophilaceae bacterium]
MSTTTQGTGQVRTYRRNTWQEAIAEYLPENRRSPRAFVWIDRLPLIGIILTMCVLSLRLRNSAMIDEALYINLGNQYLHGPLPTANDTDYISGAPGLYPVIAGALDTVAGLWLVRLFSLACMVVAVISVDRAVGALYGSRRAGIFAALAFALTAPVVFIGMFATFDALVVMLLAVALALTTSRTSIASGAGVGVLLAVASLTKYAGAPLALAVLAIMVVTTRGSPRRPLVATLAFATTLAVAWDRWSETLGPGISFTTSARVAMGPTPRIILVGTLLVTLGLLLVLALSGAFRPGPPHAGAWRAMALNVVLLGAGLALPLAQIRLGEGVSFGKHMAYSALFLAPLVGRELAAMSRGMLRLLPVGVVTAIALLVGWSGSAALYAQWVDVSPVVDVIETDPQGGTYLSSSADVLDYYTKDHPQITWDTTFALYSGGEGAIRSAVSGGDFQTVVLRTASTGNPAQDRGQAVLLEELEAGSTYELAVEPFPVHRWSDDRWLVYTKK